MTAKEENNKKFEFELNNIRGLVIGSSLNFAQRGEIYSEFKEKWKLTDAKIGELFNKERPTISREIRLFHVLKDLGLSQEGYKQNFSDRIMIRALELKSKDDVSWFLHNYKEFEAIGFSRLVSLLNGFKTVSQIERELEEKHLKIKEELKRFKAERKNGTNK